MIYRHVQKTDITVVTLSRNLYQVAQDEKNEKLQINA